MPVIARKDGSEDFIPDEAWDEFLGVLRDYDVVVMGRKTYETIQSYPATMVREFEDFRVRRVVVSQDANFKAKKSYAVISSVSEIPSLGDRVLITSGPSLNTAAFKAGIIDRVMINIVPETIGEGIPVFGEPVALDLLSTDEKPAGRKICTYAIAS